MKSKSKLFLGLLLLHWERMRQVQGREGHGRIGYHLGPDGQRFAARLEIDSST